MASIVDFWRKLTGAVHPEDQGHFERAVHTFNLDYPPPAYLGDVANAPIVLLYSNGGYDPELTPREFSDPDTVRAHVEYLHNPRPIDPSAFSPYYGRRNFSALIEDGRLVLVNAVAYRSPSLSKEPDNRRLAMSLPSRLVHERWVKTEVVAQAEAGEG